MKSINRYALLFITFFLSVCTAEARSRNISERINTIRKLHKNSDQDTTKKAQDKELKTRIDTPWKNWGNWKNWNNWGNWGNF